MKKEFFILNWKTTEVVLLGLKTLIVSVFSIFYLDHSIASYLDLTFGSTLDQGANLITWLGLADMYFWIAGIGYVLALFFERFLFHKWDPIIFKKYKLQFRFMFRVFLIPGLILVALKTIVGRCRPYNSPNFDALDFKPFNLNWDYQSYPSGHTQVSFTLAAYLSYLWPKYTIGFFILASLIAISRVILDYHYLGDVLMGAYIGLLGFYIALKKYQ